LSYVEQVNPLLFRNILYQVREQPDRLRTEKSLFKKIVVSISPKIPFATHGANASLSDILMQKQVVDLLKQKITDNFKNGIFPKDFLIDVLENVRISDNSLGKAKSFSLKLLIKSILPSHIKNLLKNNVSSLLVVDYNQIAFRIFIIFRMIDLLKTK
jgi:hypothetical protein